MSWQRNACEKIGDWLRFIGYLFLFLDVIILSAFSLWLVARFTWNLAHWLERVVFSKPW